VGAGLPSCPGCGTDLEHVEGGGDAVLGYRDWRLRDEDLRRDVARGRGDPGGRAARAAGRRIAPVAGLLCGALLGVGLALIGAASAPSAIAILASAGLVLGSVRWRRPGS
jgi:hypothetical protein